MEMIILVGIPGSGKSTYYVTNFLNSHFRISLDLLKTRNREDLFLALCFRTKLRIVIDNTNVKKAERAKYLHLAKENNYSVKCIFFDTNVKTCLLRNDTRSGKAKVKPVAIFSKKKELEIPAIEEGFDELIVF